MTSDLTSAIDEAESIWLDMKPRLAEPPMTATIEALSSLLRDIVLFQVRRYNAGDLSVEACFVAASSMRLVARDIIDALEGLYIDPQGEAAALLEFSGVEAELLRLELDDHKAFEPFTGEDMAAALTAADHAWRGTARL